VQALFSDLSVERRPALSNDQVRELNSPTSTQLRNFLALLQSKIEAWVADWFDSRFSNLDIDAVLVQDNEVSTTEKWRRYGRDGSCFWLKNASDLDKIIGQALFGTQFLEQKTNASGGLAKFILRDASTDFVTLFATFLETEGNEIVDGTLPDELLQLWSGSILLKVQIDTNTIELVLSHANFKVVLSRANLFENYQGLFKANDPSKRKALSPLLSGLSKTKVQASVELRTFELDIANVRHLAVGDVIRFNHPLDEPVLLKIGTNTEICTAYLGHCEDKIAIELLKSA